MSNLLMDSPIFAAAIVALITSILTSLGTIAVNRLSKTKTERATELLEKISKAADVTAEQLLQKLTIIHSLEERIASLERITGAMWAYIFQLVEQLRRHKIRPTCPPKELEFNAELMRLVNSVVGNGKEKDDSLSGTSTGTKTS